MSAGCSLGQVRELIITLSLTPPSSFPSSLKLGELAHTNLFLTADSNRIKNLRLPSARLE